MECVLLHVVGTDQVPSSYEVNGVPVRFFRTYAGAALHLLRPRVAREMLSIGSATGR